MQVYSERCWVYCRGAGPCLLVSGLIWLWVFIFAYQRWPGRALLIVCTGMLYIVAPYIDRMTPEGSIVYNLNGTPPILDTYRNQHPENGHPANLPEIQFFGQARKFYKFDYTAVQSRPGGPYDDYVITATPNRWCCGITHTFAMRSDGLIHYNTDQRRATLADPTLPRP